MDWRPDGWLANIGAIDFAGGIVVHISAGFSALVAALILGPRIQSPFHSDRPHNIPFVVLGASLLWFGWFGFNAGTALILLFLKKVMNIRTSPNEEIQGIDIVEHGEKAYDHAL